MQNWIITGGEGFIGSNFIRYILSKYPDVNITNVDLRTYAGKGNNNKLLEKDERYKFIRGDIQDFNLMVEIIKEGDIVVNFAAESHVDNSILSSKPFIDSNISGTHSVLEASRLNRAKLFVQVSTDEVYGSLNFDSPSSKEGDVLNPSSPYSSSKAAAEQICLGNFHTFGQAIIITRSSNNFGPFQFPEKVIPLFVTNLIQGKKVPLYGTGKNVRDWIYVEDNCSGIDHAINFGKVGEVYNIGGGNEISNLELTNRILKKMGGGEEMIEYVKDRLGHDLRYSLDTSKIKALGWEPKNNFNLALEKTIEWYKKNETWWANLKSPRSNRQTKMKGIILAGGAGTRLYPLTKVASKQLQPVYDKPMIYYPLTTLIDNGVKEICLISTPQDLPRFRQLLGNGSRFGISIDYREQAEPKGIAQAFLIAEDFIGDENVVLILGDNIFHGDDTFQKSFKDFKGGAVIFGYPVKDPERYGVVEVDENSKALSIEEKPQFPKSNLAVPGLYLYDKNVVSITRNLSPSPRGELEITDVNKKYMEMGQLKVYKLNRGWAWLDAGTSSSLHQSSAFVQTIEDRQDVKIGCPEEAAFKRGLLNLSDFEKVVGETPKGSEYGIYLKRVLDEAKSNL